MAEKILIVDDDIDSLKLIGLMLQRNGYEVVAANAGTQALTKAASELPDLIILDVMMPDMNGYDVCRRLRADTKTQAIPIIMFTAKTLIDDKVAGFEAGADDYLTKPTHPAELASRVKAILARNVERKAREAPRGMTIGVLGSKGGVGTTTLALNLGAAMMQGGDNPVIADFRLGMGSMGLFIGMGRINGMVNLLTKQPNEITPNVIENDLARHQSGLRVLLSSTNPREAHLDYSIESALAIINGLRSVGRPTIFDLGNGFSPLISQLQREMDQLILLVEPNRVSLETAKGLITELAEAGIGRINVVVVNRSQSSLQTKWQDVESSLNLEIRAILSAAPELAFQAMEAGVPMVLLQPTAIVSSQIIKLSEELHKLVGSTAD